MAASHGDGSPSRGIHGEGFSAIRQYFQQRNCRSCAQPYSPDGIELIRQEPGVIVVRVGCSHCGHPLGIALVGMNSNPPSTCAHGRPSSSRRNDYPSEWTKRDANRLLGKPAINYDDVLAAHQFFSSLDGNWTQLLPKTGKKAN